MIKRVLIDLSTQYDFLSEDGAMPVLNRTRLLPNLRRAIAWARLTHTPVVSAIDAKRENEPFNGTPRHCVDGTPGQTKIPFTLLHARTFLQADNSLSIPPNIFVEYQQVLLRKRSKDFLVNPKADRLLTESQVGEHIILGVGLEAAVKSLALGLITRLKRVAVVYDACGFWNISAADLALRQMEAKGVRLICVEELCNMRRRFPGKNGTRHNGHYELRRSSRLRDINDPRVPMPSLMRSRLAVIYNGNGNGSR
jgi:nicotinamidase-related amidase